MSRLLKILLAALMLGGVPAVAQAQAARWTVSEISGRVTLNDGGGAETAARGDIVSPGALLETGPRSRAVVVRGKDFVTVAPNSRIRIPERQSREGGLFDVLQEWGNAIFQIEKQPNPHFGVNTPYLAAVVKGTTFSITVSEQGASLQVTEGAVETSTTDGGARDLIRPGIVATVAASDRYRLTVQGQETRTIDSPLRPAGDASPLGAAQGPTIEAEPLALGEGSADFGDTPSVGTQMIAERVAAAPVDLGRVTGGLVGGMAGMQLANAGIARDAVRPVGSGPANGNRPDNGNEGGNGSSDGNPGNGNGGPATDDGSSGNGNGNQGNGNGNGGPATDDGSSGNGNGGPATDAGSSGSGNGNQGNGNGNGGPAADDGSNGNGNGKGGRGGD